MKKEVETPQAEAATTTLVKLDVPLALRGDALDLAIGASLNQQGPHRIHVWRSHRSSLGSFCHRDALQRLQL